MNAAEADSAFQRALASEILASERIRVRVLLIALIVLLIGDLLVFIFVRHELEAFTGRPMSPWLPLYMIGPFVAYEGGVLAVLSVRARRGLGMPTFARFGNAIVETSLPTVLLWAVNHYASPVVAFGTWPSLLYFVFIVASTLRLDFVLPAFTGAVAAAEYMGLVVAVLPLSFDTNQAVLSPFFHVTKAAIMLMAGIVAGLVAVRLRSKFAHAVDAAAARDRVTNLFGQHVSPAVVERLLDQPADFAGDAREICVMFLDIRNFTAQSRTRTPAEVVGFLNGIFAFMIEAIDRHHGFINKFLGDGFMAVFGAPLEDPDAARNAVAAARDILAEIDRRGLAQGAWPLRVGIGINLGLAVTGNIGSPRRKEFTAIGDTVNLAARLEQLTKETGARLLVSESVIAACGQESGPATPLGTAAVKGYAEPVPVWRLD